MNLNLNSWYVKLWNFTYSTTHLPNNLCPFFWKLVAAILLFIPNLVLRIPVYVTNLFYKHKIDRIRQGDGRTGMGVGLYLILAVIILVIISFWHLGLYLFTLQSYDIGLVGFSLFCIAVGIILFTMHWLKNRNSKRKIHSFFTNNILITFTKAKYNKYCPSINWIKK